MLESAIAKEGEVNIVYLTGRLNASNSEEFAKILLGLVTPSSNQVVLELSELTYISSNGLKPLLLWLEATKGASGKRKLSLCCLQEFVQTVFSVTGFDRKFPVFSSLESALDGF